MFDDDIVAQSQADEQESGLVPLENIWSIVTPRVKKRGRRAVRVMLKLIGQKTMPDYTSFHYCMAALRPRQSMVTAVYSHKYDSAAVRGVTRCGSPWICPVCAARIAEIRRAELNQGVERAAALGWQAELFTLTVRHKSGQSLKKLVADVQNAIRKLQQGKGWAKYFKEKYDLAGTVKALECTWSAVNGWHPHFHMIMWFRHPVDAEAVRADLATRWQVALAKVGRSADFDEGVNLSPNRGAVGDYVLKYGFDSQIDSGAWSTAKEIASGVLKSGKRGLTYLQLLAAYGGIFEMEPIPGQELVALLREYAAAFFGRHQLEWSKGLRAALGLGAELSDEAAAEDVPPDVQDVVMAQFSINDWRVILEHNWLPDLLDTIEDAGPTGDLARVSAWCGDHGLPHLLPASTGSPVV